MIMYFRRMMIEKIASHLADFSPRLHSNTRALYQYCPIPLVNYPQLENELFCNIYYLRHLCDTTKFPDWPIKEPVSACYQINLVLLPHVSSKYGSKILNTLTAKSFHEMRKVYRYIDRGVCTRDAV